MKAMSDCNTHGLRVAELFTANPSYCALTRPAPAAGLNPAGRTTTCHVRINNIRMAD